MLLLNNIKLQWKLTLIVGALCLPIAILAYLFIGTTMDDIAVTKGEQAGVDYTRAVWTIKGSLTDAGLAKAEPSRFLTEPAELEAMSAKYDTSMGTTVQSDALKAGLAQVGFPGQALTDSARAKTVIAQSRALMSRIADASKLTLDSDLDSAYLVKFAVNRQPLLGDSVFTVANDIEDKAASKTSATAADQAKLYADILNLTTSYKNAMSALNTAYAGNPSGKLKAALSVPQAALDQAMADLTAKAQAAVDALGSGKPADYAAVSSQGLTALKANRAMAFAALTEFDNLLQARTNAALSHLWLMLAIAGLTTAAALALTVYISRELSGTLNRLTGVMTRLANNDFSMEIPGTTRTDEMGVVAKCVAVLKANAKEQFGVVTTDLRGQVAAISRAQALIEFDLAGKILTANENFLAVVGYSLDQIQGQHHSMFVDPAYRASAEYHQFWERLARGEYDAGQYKRLRRDGGEVWLQASYNPIMDLAGKPFKVVKYATDITAQKLQSADFEGQIAAISKAQAVIEFDMTGKILNANENFARTMGYTQDELKGKHHSMFAEADYRASSDYRSFWERLGRGEYDAGQYKRIGREGRVVWLQASYNPILDMNGKPFKVVKYATDITEQVTNAQALADAVNQSKTAIDAAKANDLTSRVDMTGKSNEIALMCSGINDLLETTAGIVSNVLEASSTISTATAEITAGTNDLSQRTEQQASNLQETASSMEEMASTIKQNADNAQEASKLASAASGVATTGGVVVSNAVEAMSRIESSSQKISDIIGVIDEIAFQTNLLALNAAVEAARAGDAGKGFAVVAAEVRSLAQRSSGAAKDIKTLIAASGNEVKDGVKLVNDAGGALSEIVGSIKKVADIVSEIAAASREQSSGVEEINKAISQMDEMTQQNSALVEQNAASSRMLQDQAEAMYERMSIFTVPGMAHKASSGASVGTSPGLSNVRAMPKPAPQARAPSPKLPVRKVANGGRSAAEKDADWAEF